jgi:hypothetical protein
MASEQRIAANRRNANLTDPLKLSDACCQNCVSWTATSAALPRSETERLSVL